MNYKSTFIIVFNLTMTQYLKNGIFTIQIPDFAAAHINACTWVLQIKRTECKEDSKAKNKDTENPIYQLYWSHRQIYVISYTVKQ